MWDLLQDIAGALAGNDLADHIQLAILCLLVWRHHVYAGKLDRWIAAEKARRSAETEFRIRELEQSKGKNA